MTCTKLLLKNPPRTLMSWDVELGEISSQNGKSCAEPLSVCKSFVFFFNQNIAKKTGKSCVDPTDTLVKWPFENLWHSMNWNRIIFLYVCLTMFALSLCLYLHSCTVRKFYLYMCRLQLHYSYLVVLLIYLL